MDTRGQQSSSPITFKTNIIGRILDFRLENFSVSSAPIPKPSTMLLLECRLIGLAGYGRKKFFKK